MEIEFISGGVCAAKGFKASGVHSGMRKNKLKKDLALIYCEKLCSAAAAYTQNKVKGAPITVSKKHLENGRARAIICNSGNANTCAPNGIEIAEKTCGILGKELGIPEDDIIVASTGVIGERLDISPFANGIPKLVRRLSDSVSGSFKASQAMMTTDTVEKSSAVTFIIDNKQCQLGGIAKGSGMINPNMATMLCFLTTDAAISPDMLQKALSREVEDSFNQICVDGDTSTNDTVAIMASGLAGNREITADGYEFDRFCAALKAVVVQLCKKVARDGEGATKLIECVVSEAPDRITARKIAKSVVSSSLVKSAAYGEDANWGRILCAVGYTDAEFDAGRIDVVISSKNGNVEVCRDAAHVEFSERAAAKILSAKEIKILVSLKQGEAAAAAWGCDLTYDYVKINGNYRA